jgi:hypothetical protein
VESDHYLLTASAEFSLLVAMAETCLKNQGFDFIQNRTNNVVEYEVERPAYFRIVIHRRNDAQVGNFLMPSIKAAKGTFLDVWFSPDQDEFSDHDASQFARKFLRSLADSLPQPPWEGLKYGESGKAKRKWKDLIGQNP